MILIGTLSEYRIFSWNPFLLCVSDNGMHQYTPCMKPVLACVNELFARDLVSVSNVICVITILMCGPQSSTMCNRMANHPNNRVPQVACICAEFVFAQYIEFRKYAGNAFDYCFQI